MKQLYCVLAFWAVCCLPVAGQVWKIMPDGRVAAVRGQENPEMRMSARSVSEETVRVTMRSEQPINNFVIVGDGVKVKNAQTSESRVFTIPKGEYMLGAMYVRSQPVMQWDIREKVRIDSDTTILFSPTNAVNRVSFRPKGPEGREFLTPAYKYTPTIEFDYTGANLEQEAVCNVICHKSGLLLAILSGNPRGHDENGKEEHDTYDFKVSPVSDDIIMAEYRLVNWLDGSVSVIQLETKGCTADTIVSNRTDIFRDLSAAFQRSASFDRKNLTEAVRVVTGHLSGVAGKDPDMRLNALQYDSSATINVNVAPLEQTGTSMAVSVMECEQSKSTAAGISVDGIQSVPMYFSDGQWMYTDSGTQVFMQSEFRFGPDGQATSVWPGHDAFSGAAGKFKVLFGASSPVNCFLVQRGTSNGKPVVVFMPHYIGMAGESRGIDNYHTRTELFSGTRSLGSGTGPVMISEEDAKKAGRLRIRFENSNVQTDGGAGGNVSEYEFSLSATDHDAPSLRRLAIRNSKGEITNVLSPGEEGVLMLAAADFNLPTGAAYRQIEDAEVTVECSRHDADDWYRVNVSPLAGYERRPSFGTLYEGRLEGVSDGWHDLRVSLQDAAGNTSVQTLSRAFCVGGNDGVDTTLDDMEIDVSGRRIIAPEGAEVYNISGIRAAEGELTPGVYMVKYNNQTVKVIVK